MKLRQRHPSRLILVGLLLMAACGCNAVLSKHPVGDSPARIETKEWEGNWITSDGAVSLKVLDADKGILRASWVEDGRNGTPTKSAEIEVRESGGWLIASARDDKGRGYFWGRIKNEDGQIIVWSPDERLFAKAVKDGVLPGRVEGDDVILDDLKPHHLKVITDTEKGVLFSWDRPSIFVKSRN